MTFEEVRKKLKRLRAKSGLSAVELAKRAGVTRLTVYRIEGNYRAVSHEAVAKVAAALGFEFGVTLTPSSHHQLKFEFPRHKR